MKKFLYLILTIIFIAACDYSISNSIQSTNKSASEENTGENKEIQDPNKTYKR